MCYLPKGFALLFSAIFVGTDQFEYSQYMVVHKTNLVHIDFLPG